MVEQIFAGIVDVLFFAALIVAGYYFGKSKKLSKPVTAEPVQVKAEADSLVINGRAQYVGLVGIYDKYILKSGEDLVTIGKGDLIYRDKAVKTTYLDKDGKEKEVLAYVDYTVSYRLPSNLEDLLYTANKVDITKDGRVLFFDQPLSDAVEESAKKFNLADWIGESYKIKIEVKAMISKLFRDAKIDPSSVYFNIERVSFK
jgi:hypothetical protein